MLLTDLQTHLTNNGIFHKERLGPFYDHDIFINPENGNEVTVPIMFDEIPDLLAEMACFILAIEQPFQLS